MKQDFQLSLSLLRTLIAIDQEGSFGAAARKIGRTQPAVTQQMKNLERNIGTSLFVTKGRRRELTEAGRTLLRHSHEIISLCTQAMSASGKSHNSGIIKIGAPMEIANDLLPDILRAFSRKWPRVQIVLAVERSGVLMKMLEEGALDLTLSTWRSGSSEGARVRMLSVHWIAAKTWRYDPKEPLPLVVTDSPSMFRRIALTALELNGWTYYERFTSRTTSGIRFGIEACLGITARTRSAFRSDIEILDTKMELPSLPKVSYFLHRTLNKSSPALDDLYDLIIASAS
ncbi:LysR family transcriptional regulator [Devosia sp.]|uniref:LysR family transcriptional regulator n=1 Tax=Devosia sp. TaxID=1871048 RepID=UPI0027348973|nr:LysR family transcriptional regulator [Devosia sp.]MDP2779715.1 LysR family transcriptional regulator [Devosia sp.]